jgi:hypothetical protein
MIAGSTFRQLPGIGSVAALLWIVSLLVAFILQGTCVVGYAPLTGVMVTPVTLPSETSPSPSSVAAPVDIGLWLTTPTRSEQPQQQQRSMIVFGTYAADFNAIEYGQRLRYYFPILQSTKNISKCAILLNCNIDAARAYQQYLDLPNEIELFVDPTGAAGRTFGVQRGWIPDNTSVHPYMKLFGMLWGLGAWETLPAVISGYIGNPFVKQPWITDALMVGNIQKRWPMNALELSEEGALIQNKFDELPIFGSWGRRPLELATLRLQSMMGISLAHWDELKPDDMALDAGVLTQLGGCLITEGASAIYEWKDPGICAVANFEDILKTI